MRECNYSDAEMEKIKFYAEKVRAEDISVILHEKFRVKRSKRAIQMKIKRMGLTGRIYGPKLVNRDQLEDILKMSERGVRVLIIAILFNTTPQTINSYLSFRSCFEN